MQETKETKKTPRGFALLPRDQVRALARAGGQKAHELGVAHKFTSEEAKIAGRQGGRASQQSRRKSET